MKFTPLKLEGSYLIEPEPISDERGYFARLFCREEFENRGLNSALDQCSISFNSKKRTVRGMHFQSLPYAEIKMVRCTQGKIYDVVVDLRPRSPTYKQWEGVILSAQNHRMLYIPEGFAHGFQTLEDETEVFYQISSPFVASSTRGVRWDDPAIRVQWPEPVSIISLKDQQYADFASL